MLALLALTQQIPVDTAAMDAHLRFLASDLLEGRAPATRGGRLAAEYIAAQFQVLGLEPAGENGTYFQPVARRDDDTPGILVGKQGPPRHLARDCWSSGPSGPGGRHRGRDFVGYGPRA
jgi:hypothetical protein